MGNIKIKYKGDMLFETTIGKHTIKIDVPDAMNGKDRGMTPPQLFLASLSSCIAAFIANYCNNAGIDTTDMSVDMDFEKKGEPARFTDLKIKLHLPNGDYAAREKAILKVAEHCPVHETLHSFDGLTIEISK